MSYHYPRPTGYYDTLKSSVLVLVLISVLIGLGAVMAYELKHPIECVRSSRVLEITSVAYRSATFRMSDGTSVTVSQPSKAKGDLMCVDYRRKP